MDLTYDRSTILNGNRLRRQAEERPPTFAEYNGATDAVPSSNLDVTSNTRMAGPAGLRALELMNNPDVSKDEYRRYKAFKFDKKEDYNPFDDGKFGLGMGALKYTSEGIHGPELQFLGRGLPLTTGMIPYAGATLGAAAGVRYGGKKPIRRGLYGGFGGLAAGNVLGNLVEGERRRRNAAENENDKL